jgi:hypothetical protein
MMKLIRSRLLTKVLIVTLPAALCAIPQHTEAQTKKTTVLAGDNNSNLVIAGQYKMTPWHQFWFGKHYRKEWATPVTVPSIRLDTIAGGLTPYEESGGRQSKGLKLRDKEGHEYVLRTVDKSFERAIPEIYRGTFIQDWVNDQVTISHPYAAFTIPQMAEAAKIYHTDPIIGYIPRQAALKGFSNKYGNYLYMLEQRPDENWSTADNFGNAKNIVGTDKMLEKILEDPQHKVDQVVYARARLFDMFIGDWGRHDDNWRWAEMKEGNKVTYKPIPRDRDQAYSKFDGVLPKAVLMFAKLEYLQSFNYTIKDVKSYGFTARFLDHHLLTEVTEQQWKDQARDLQRLLTNEVIEKAVRQMPPEVFDISGGEIISKLKSRRDHLEEFATTYYKFLARHVDITGTQERDYFEVNRLNNNETSVRVYGYKNNAREATPYYARTFYTSETKDVRLYAIKGPDVFRVTGKVRKGITVRIVGSEEPDSVIDDSRVRKMGHQTLVYDNKNNVFRFDKEDRLHVGYDSATFAYDYKNFAYHKKGFQLLAYYDNPDRMFVALAYRFARHGWRKDPFKSDQSLQLRYSFSQNAISLIYNGTWYQALGKWNVNLWANYDAVRWTNFFGLGNQTVKQVDNVSYYRLHTTEYYVSLGVNRWFNYHHYVDVRGYFQGIEVLDEPGTFVSQNYTPNDLFYFHHHNYLGARASYAFQDVDDIVVPQKGVMLYGGYAYQQNVGEQDKGFGRFDGIGHAYIPLFAHLSLALRAGVSTVHGTPEFYQYASIGGPMNMRGYWRDRFWGNTGYYNCNELRYIRDIRTHLLNGKAGLLVLFDNGRVWYKGEESNNTIHTAVGGGFMIAPFNLINASVVYAGSSDGGLIQMRVATLLNPHPGRKRFY